MLDGTGGSVISGRGAGVAILVTLEHTFGERSRLNVSKLNIAITRHSRGIRNAFDIYTGLDLHHVVRVDADHEALLEPVIRNRSYPRYAVQVLRLERHPRVGETTPTARITVRDGDRHLEIPVDVVLSLLNNM